MTIPKLIYCAGGNKRFAEIAIESGFLYGARIPNDKPHFKIYFADQDWRYPNRTNYMRELERYRPTVATVLDIEDARQLNEVLSWAEEATQYCDYVVVIPKVTGIIKKIPPTINQKEVILGYSVPTGYGHTNVPINEFDGRLVHLLGGSPHKQLELCNIMSKTSKVVSVDGNYVQKMAVRFNKFWTNGDATYARNRWLPRLDEKFGNKIEIDAPYLAFKISCENIISAWSRFRIVI